MRRSSLFMLCLLPVLALSACSPSPAPAAPDPQTQTRGSVTGYTGGAGTVRLVVGGQTLTSAPISAAGQFSLPLPQAGALTGRGVRADAYPAFVDGCARDARVSAPAAELVVIGSLGVQTAGGAQTLSRFSQSYDPALDASSSVQDVLVHASSAVEIYGEVSCAATQKRASYSVLLRLDQGWNTVRLTQSVLAGQEIRAVTQFTSVSTMVNTTWKVGSIQALSR